MIETVGTGVFSYDCAVEGSVTPTYASFDEAVAEGQKHRRVCEECDTWGVWAREIQDVEGTEEVSFSNANAAAVFSFVGVKIDGYDDGDFCGTINAGVLLAACQVALATETPVLFARPSHVSQNTYGGRFIECGLDEEELIVRVRKLADVASEGVRLGRDIVWS